VDFTAAAEGNFFLQAVDATDRRKQTVKLASVAITDCTERDHGVSF
jgi:hypothetical protein